MTPRVSVITPYRDAARYIAEAIESVQAQTIGDWEMLLVDDRSSDGGPDIASTLAGKDDRVRIFETVDRRGAAAARNVGLRAARGEFVVFLDADDILLPDAIETGLAIARSHPSAALVCGAARWWHPDRESLDWVDCVRRIRPGIYDPPFLLEELILLKRDQVPCTCAVLVRREAAVAVGGFEESLSLYEDQSLWVRLLARHPAYIGRHLTSLYRQHEGSTSARAARAGDYHRLRSHPARKTFLEWVGRDLSKSARPTTVSALRIARMVAGAKSEALPLSDRPRHAALKVRNGASRLKRRFGSLARRFSGKRSGLPPIAR